MKVYRVRKNQPRFHLTRLYIYIYMLVSQPGPATV